MVTLYQVKQDYSEQIQAWVDAGNTIKTDLGNSGSKPRFNDPSADRINEIEADKVERELARSMGSEQYISQKQCAKCKSKPSTRFVSNNSCAFCKKVSDARKIKFETFAFIKFSYDGSISDKGLIDLRETKGFFIASDGERYRKPKNESNYLASVKNRNKDEIKIFPIHSDVAIINLNQLLTDKGLMSSDMIKRKNEIDFIKKVHDLVGFKIYDYDDAVRLNAELKLGVEDV